MNPQEIEELAEVQRLKAVERLGDAKQTVSRRPCLTLMMQHDQVFSKTSKGLLEEESLQLPLVVSRKTYLKEQDSQASQTSSTSDTQEGSGLSMESTPSSPKDDWSHLEMSDQELKECQERLDSQQGKYQVPEMCGTGPMAGPELMQIHFPNLKQQAKMWPRVSDKKSED